MRCEDTMCLEGVGMTDLKIIKLCAEAMGYQVAGNHGDAAITVDGMATNRYDPLHDDAQAMALVKQFPIDTIWAMWEAIKNYQGHLDLNRAICECVAKMQEKKNVPIDSAARCEAAQPDQIDKDGGTAGAGISR